MVEVDAVVLVNAALFEKEEFPETTRAFVPVADAILKPPAAVSDAIISPT